MKINQNEVSVTTAKVARKLSKSCNRLAANSNNADNAAKTIIVSRKLPNCIGAPDEIYNSAVIYSPDYKEALKQIPQWIKDIINK